MIDVEITFWQSFRLPTTFGFFFSGSWELLNLNFGVRNYYASASILAQAATQVSFLTGGFFQASIVIPAPKIA
jgi:hypothetical protein